MTGLNINNLTHVDTEREQQRLHELTKNMSLAEMRLARALCADIIEEGRYGCELIALRGSILDNAIQRREQGQAKGPGFLRSFFLRELSSSSRKMVERAVWYGIKRKSNARHLPDSK